MKKRFMLHTEKVIDTEQFFELDLKYPVWDRFFMVHPLVIIGSIDKSGKENLAPKHMVTPMGWSNYFGFMCTPNHSTYDNIKREGYFSVSFPKPEQVLFTSLSAAPREHDDTKPALNLMPTFLLEDSKMPVLQDSYIFFECEAYKIYDDFEVNSLITGKITKSYIDKLFLRDEARDDNDLIREQPVLSYLNPGRFAVISENQSFPFPKDFKK